MDDAARLTPTNDRRPSAMTFPFLIGAGGLRAAFRLAVVLVSGRSMPMCRADRSACGAFASSEDVTGGVKLDEDIGKSRDALRTDDEVVQREEEAIKLDGLNVAQIKEIRDKAEKFMFQAEVSRMMKLIINSLYRNKEIFLRELISNASDALDKIRLISLTDRSALDATEELSIRIKADKENHILHITDTGIGMTKNELVSNLGTIAKSGTAEFLNKLAESTDSQEENKLDMGDLIGQFGVGFYSSFLVADRVVVTSKHNDDKQHIWESDAANFNIMEDPRGPTLKRGTTVSLYLKEEALDFLEEDTIRDLIKKYSQFINFPIYLWCSKTVKVEEAEEEAEKEEDELVDEGEVTEEKTETKGPKEKTVWDWEKMNTSKPIWMRKSHEIEEEEYNDFYKTLTKGHDNPMTRIHFTAEGEVTFRSLLYIPKELENEILSNYGKKHNIKLYVRRVVKLGVVEDPSNRTRLAKLLRFRSSHGEGWSSLQDYVERSKQGQRFIYYIGGGSKEEVEASPFVELLLKKGYEVLYLLDPIDEYCIQSLPEFEGRKFQNVAREGLELPTSDEAKKSFENLKERFQTLTKWLGENALKDQIAKAELSQRLAKSPCTLVASVFGWTGNMQRIMSAQTHTKHMDPHSEYYMKQKKTMEINPRHPIIQELLRRVEEDPADPVAHQAALTLYRTAVLRSGYQLTDATEFAEAVEGMMRQSLGVPLDAEVEEDDTIDEPAAEQDVPVEPMEHADEDEHDEL
ncbi:unnamed protein product [Darwinula stevensoni]|uniref:Heat shock protein 83 n=1 Tax=Darwinula stevensoni TaxID=69355 RepID=A0A7R8XHC1_9CRUS|nr:unnamed protein product [Darwinula stevensoni]CAG0890293.1 unnamed protein product [Darwinula stevensoni]